MRRLKGIRVYGTNWIIRVDPHDEVRWRSCTYVRTAVEERRCEDQSDIPEIPELHHLHGRYPSTPPSISWACFILAATFPFQTP